MLSLAPGCRGCSPPGRGAAALGQEGLWELEPAWAPRQPPGSAAAAPSSRTAQHRRVPVPRPGPYCSLVWMGPCSALAQTGPHPALWVPDLLPSPCPAPVLVSLPSPSSLGPADPRGLWAVPCVP